MSLIPRAPQDTLEKMVTYELRDYRAALENALTKAPQGSAERTIIRNRLLKVVGEQAERARKPLPATGTWADAS